MAITNCFECKKEVSDKATSCPHCGNPLKVESGLSAQVTNNSNSSPHITIEPQLTSKKWKKVKIISVLAILVGIILWATASSTGSSVIGFFLGVSGIMALVVAKIGAWYEDKRTR